MHAAPVLQKILSPVIAQLDARNARNARNLLCAVEALLVGRRLTLMELARHFPGAERIQAPLKRLDRLLGNHKVQALRVLRVSGSPYGEYRGHEYRGQVLHNRMIA